MFTPSPNDYFGGYGLDQYENPGVLETIRESIVKAIGDRPGFGGISFADHNSIGIYVYINHLRTRHLKRLPSLILRYEAVGHKSMFSPA